MSGPLGGPPALSSLSCLSRSDEASGGRRHRTDGTTGLVP